MGLLDVLSNLNAPNGPVAQAVSSPLFNLGAGLLSARYTPFSNGGAGLLQGAQSFSNQRAAQQQYQQNQMQLDMLKQQMPILQGLFHQLSGQPSAPSGGLLASQPQGAAQAFPSAPGTAPAPSADDSRAQIMQQFNAGIAYSMFPMTKDAGAGLIKKAQFMAQYDPALAQQMELVKSTVGQDQALLEQAQRSGNQTMIQGATVKLLKDLGLVSVANNNGAVTTFGGVTPDMLGMNSRNPAQGIEVVGGQERAIPGAPQAEAAIAQAKSGGEAAGQAPYELVKVTGPDGTEYMVPKSALVGPQGGAKGGPAVAALGPGSEAALRGQGEQAVANNKDFQDQAENAVNMITQVETLKDDAANFTPGPRADQRAFALRALYSAGLITQDQAKALGSYESGQKVAIQLQAAATKALGSREAAQIFSIMGKSLPNLSLSKVGLQNVAAYQEGIARYQQARAAWANQKFAANDYKGVNSARDVWIKSSNPLYYIVASAPPEIQGQMLQAMGAKRAKFVADWNAAANAGFAPRPGEYNGAGP